jgi:mono/diheme cytochrome c family protein
MRKTIIVAVCVVAAIGAGAIWWMGDGPSPEVSTITLPRLTTAQAAGKTLFDANCAACHGRNATGTEQGPPLVHIIYEPNHHGDASFYRAAALGVRAHHWRFGNMAAVEGVTEADVAKIIDYVRALQRANGIE